jgi:hypothetical protein
MKKKFELIYLGAIAASLVVFALLVNYAVDYQSTSLNFKNEITTGQSVMIETNGYMKCINPGDSTHDSIYAYKGEKNFMRISVIKKINCEGEIVFQEHRELNIDKSGVKGDVSSLADGNYAIRFLKS